jgi:D-alanyl-D-alanine carboxypeptidase/D-alanyl-D-alanine-endopeptidase (penicillin-binding protein 4)
MDETQPTARMPRVAAGTPSAPRPRRTREEMRWVFYRRRATVGAGAFVVLWLVAQALGGLSGWLAGDPAADASPPQANARDDDAAPPTTEAPCPPGGTTVPRAEEDPPDDLLTAVDAALADYGLTRYTTGASIWVDGYGLVVDQDAGEPLAPASNQKILTAMGVLELLDPELRLVTQLRATGPVTDDGVLEGDLVVVGGGDPLIKKTGSHSIADIARRLDEAGITRIEGDIVGDESRYDQVRKAPGWLEWEMPLPAGAMSALMVNSNSRLGDADYLADPTIHNVSLLIEALDERGIDVEGGPATGTVPDAADVVLEYRSPTVASMVETMLRESDNMTAEMLVKEVGLQVTGEGSSTAGMDAMVGALEDSLCIEIDGVNDDASGISRDNRRTPADWVELLVAARDEPWFDTFYGGLPVAGEEGGTLATRFLGTSAVGDVHAKTGTIGTAVALSGYATTEGDRDMVFSVVVNGDQPEDTAVPAIDQLLVAVQADES